MLAKPVKDAVVLVAVTVDAFLKAKKDDGKIDKKDLPKLLPILMPALQLAGEADELIPALKAVQGSDVSEMAELLLAECPSLKDQAKAIPRVRAALNLIGQIVETVKVFKS